MSALIRSTCRADIDNFIGLASDDWNRNHLRKLTGRSRIMSSVEDGVIWRYDEADVGVVFFVAAKKLDTIGLYISYRKFVISPIGLCLEVSCWQSSILGGFCAGWRSARDIALQQLLDEHHLLVSSSRLNRSGSRFWEDRVGRALIEGHHGGFVRNDSITYQHDADWFAPDDLGRDGVSRFFIQAA